MKTIVVADDMPEITSALKRMLSQNYEVIEAHSGSEVLDICDARRVDGLMLDINFESGGMSGLDTAASVRKSYPDLKIVLFSSAEYSGPELSRVLELGTTFLPKPIKAEQVLHIFG